DPKHVEEVHGDLDALRRTSFDALEHPDRAKFRKRMEWLMAADKVTDEIVEVRHCLWSRPETNRALKAYYERLFDPSCNDFLFDEAIMSKIDWPTLVSGNYCTHRHSTDH